MNRKNELIKDIASRYSILEDEKSQAFYKFLRQVLISSTTLLGILISFYSKSENDSCNHILFSISVSTCAIGILAVAFLLFAEVLILKDVQRQLQKELEHMTEEEYVVKETYVWKGKVSKLFSAMEWVASISFVLFLISLVAYVIF